MRKVTLLLLIPFLLFSESFDDREKQLALEEREVELKERKAKLKEQELALERERLSLEERTLKLKEQKRDLKKRDKREKQRYFTNWRDKSRKNRYPTSSTDDSNFEKRYYFSVGTGYKLFDMEYENVDCWECEEDIIENQLSGSSTRLNFGIVTDSDNRLEFYYSYNYLGFKEILDGKGGYTSGIGFSHKLISNIYPISPYFKYGFEWLTTNLSEESRVKEGLMDGFGVNIGLGFIYNLSKNIDIDLSFEKGFNSYYLDVVTDRCDYFDEYYGSCSEEQNQIDVYDSYILTLLSVSYKF
jgi:hypothetical protein